jgi:hypothetical protein
LIWLLVGPVTRKICWTHDENANAREKGSAFEWHVPAYRGAAF